MKVKLLVVQGRPAGKTLMFPRGDYYIGRGAECHVRPESEWVSRQHCLLRVAQEAVCIRDLGSRNGTLVNGVLVDREQRLNSGDQVQIGPLVFEVQFDLVELPPEMQTLTDTVNHQLDALTQVDPLHTRDDSPEELVETKDVEATQHYPPLSDLD